MDSSEASLDEIEAQRSTEESHDTESAQGNININLRRLFNSRPSLLFNLPGEFVPMNPEIFSAMRAGKSYVLRDYEGGETPMACLKSDRGDSVLHLAAAWGHVELVKTIYLKYPCLLYELNWMDRLPLHVAARAGHLAVVKGLEEVIKFFAARLSEGDAETLNIYVLKDINGDTPLHLAMKNHHEMAEVLMHHRRIGISVSDSDISTVQIEIAARLVRMDQRASFLANKDGISPLYMAIEAGNVSLVKSMLHCPGYNIHGDISNLASNLEGRRSLVHVALKAKNIELLNVILEEDPSLVNERDEEGRTCLSVGAFVGFYEGVCNLLDRSTSNSSVFECDDDGSFPIHVAVEKGHMDIVRAIRFRCPYSECMVNKKGQNILHIAAKKGKHEYFRFDYMMEFDMLIHLMEEQDVDGNTPLHLATINWRPRTLFYLTNASAITKILNIQNNNGLKALDIAEINLQSDYVLRERMTLLVLLCVYAPRGVAWLQTSGMTLRSRSEHLDANKYKEHVNALLLVATLVATVAFAAGFTIPGGFNSSAPNLGMSILANGQTLSSFLVFDTLAMQSSVIAIVALIWAQLGDPAVVHQAFHLALPMLCVALMSMSLAFFFGVRATIKHNHVLSNALYAIFFILYNIMAFFLLPYVIPQVPGFPFLQKYTKLYIPYLLWFVNEDDDEKHYTSGSGRTGVKRMESMRSSSSDQVEKSNVP